jgi:hypothetical protein
MIDGVNARYGLSHDIRIAHVSHHDLRTQARQVLDLAPLPDQCAHAAARGAQVTDEGVPGIPPGSGDEYPV